MNNRILVLVMIISGALTGTSCSNTDRASSPILVLASQNNFGLFTGEILKTEGFNDFKIDSLGTSQITTEYLAGFDIVILAETPVNASEEKILTEYVSEGGNLIAFRPDKELSHLFGISNVEGVVSEGYLAADTNTGIGKGITTETLQFHGDADKYNTDGGQTIAALFTDANT